MQGADEQRGSDAEARVLAAPADSDNTAALGSFALLDGSVGFVAAGISALDAQTESPKEVGVEDVWLGALTA